MKQSIKWIQQNDFFHKQEMVHFLYSRQKNTISKNYRDEYFCSRPFPMHSRAKVLVAGNNDQDGLEHARVDFFDHPFYQSYHINYHLSCSAIRDLDCDLDRDEISTSPREQYCFVFRMNSLWTIVARRCLDRLLSAPTSHFVDANRSRPSHKLEEILGLRVEIFVQKCQLSHSGSNDSRRPTTADVIFYYL